MARVRYAWHFMGLNFVGTQAEQHAQFLQWCRANRMNVNARYYLREHSLVNWTNAFVKVLACVRIFNVIKLERSRQRLLACRILSTNGIFEPSIRRSICYSADLTPFQGNGASVLRLNRDRYNEFEQESRDVWQAQLRRLLKDRYGESYIWSPLDLDWPFGEVNYKWKKPRTRRCRVADVASFVRFLEEEGSL